MIYIKLHQVDSKDALKFTWVEIHHINVYIYTHLIEVTPKIRLKTNVVTDEGNSRNEM